MHIRIPHTWPATVEEAVSIQETLRHLVRQTPLEPSSLQHVAGLDVAYAPDSNLLAAAVVILESATLTVIEERTAVGEAAFDYVPGMFAFRELPTLVDALSRVQTTPDLLICDGHGLSHPRRFGLACHVGIVTDLPTIGVAKTRFIGEYDPLGPKRGDAVDLRDRRETIGRVLRTQDEIKPVFVSVGHRVNLDDASHIALALSPRYRLPETTRRADQCARHALQAL